MPDPRPGEALRSKPRAAAETAAATAVYLGVALGGVRRIDISHALSWLTGHQATVVSGFIVGSLSQITAVVLIWLVLRPVDLAEATAKVRAPSSREGWFIALTIIAVEITVMYGVFVDVGGRALEPSALNVTGSLAPLLDGVTQEVFFRGYLILRLARGGYGPVAQLLFSSLAFTATHVGYVGDVWGSVLPPLLGTLGLGVALGWAFIRGIASVRRSLRTSQSSWLSSLG